MQKINFKNLPDTSTPLNASTLNQMQDNIESAIESAINSTANLICPIGRTVIFYDNEDHSDYLGFTWVRTSIGKFPIGIDSNDADFDTIGNTGGEKTHTLIQTELPSSLNVSMNTSSPSGSLDGQYLSYGSSSDIRSRSYTLDNTGGGQPHNIMPPYEVMAFWKRVS